MDDTSPWAKQLVGKIYALQGRKAEAAKVIDELKALSSQRFIVPTYFFELYALLGEKDQAFEWIEKAYETDSLADLKTNPFIGSLRSDPRYRHWMRRIHLS